MLFVVWWAVAVRALSYFDTRLVEVASVEDIDPQYGTHLYDVAGQLVAPVANSSLWYAFNVSTRYVELDGYMAVSPCHSQRMSPFGGSFTVDHAEGHEVRVETLLTSGFKLDHGILGIVTVMAGFDLKLGIVAGTTVSRGVTHSCKLEPGQMAQALVKPLMVEYTTRGVVGELVDALYEATRPVSQPVSEMLTWRWPLENTGIFRCVYDREVVELPCNARVNYLDPEHPIQLEFLNASHGDDYKI
ncbi:hypothetical protein DICA3_E15852 [Diutina catenulata]